MYDNLLKDLLPIISNVMLNISKVLPIITFLFAAVKCIADYEYGKKCEEKFKIPHNLFSFNIEEVLIGTFEYILMLILIYILVVFIEFCKKYSVVNSLVCSLMLYPCLFLYMIGTVGIIYSNKEKIKNRKPDLLCEVLKFILKFILVPLVLSVLYYFGKININYLKIIMIIITVIIALFFFYSHSNVDKKKFNIVKYNDELVAILGYSKDGFIIIDIKDNNDGIYKVKKEDLGNYRIVNKVSLLDRKSGIIEVCNEGG